MSLRERAFAAVKWTALAALLRGGLQVGQLAILARLLTPSDFGVMAVATAILSVANLLSDGGLSSAYIQRRAVSHNERSSLYWLNVLIAASLAVMLVLLSGFIGEFYRDERLKTLVMLTAPILIINGFGQQLRADCEKGLRFKQLAICEVFAALAGVAIAVLAAASGAGVFALAYGAVVTALTATILFWLTASHGWRPTIRLSIEDVRGYSRFGISALGASIVNQLNMNSDLLVGGRMVSSAQLGLYSVSRNLILQTQFLLNPIVTRVSFPLIAESLVDQAKVRDIYLGSLKMAAYMTAPIYAMGIFFAPQVSSVLLGEQWTDAKLYVQILCAWGFLRSLANTHGSLLLGCGQPDLALKWNALLLLLLPPSIVAGARFLGAEGIAYALLGVSVVLVVPSWYYFVRRLCGVELPQYLLAFTIPCVYAIFAAALASGVSALFQHPVLQLGIGSVVAAATYLGLAHLTNPSLASIVKLSVPRFR